MKCDIKFKVRDDPLSQITCKVKDIEYCLQAAVALFSKENDHVSHDSCNKKCKQTLRLETLVRTLWNLNI